jgi:hypothetical protein
MRHASTRCVHTPLGGTGLLTLWPERAAVKVRPDRTPPVAPPPSLALEAFRGEGIAGQVVVRSDVQVAAVTPSLTPFAIRLQEGRMRVIMMGLAAALLGSCRDRMNATPSRPRHCPHVPNTFVSAGGPTVASRGRAHQPSHRLAETRLPLYRDSGGARAAVAEITVLRDSSGQGGSRTANPPAVCGCCCAVTPSPVPSS